MTIQLRSLQFGKNKRVLEDALNEHPEQVQFFDPSVFQGRGLFRANVIRRDESLIVVMDPLTRKRFSTVTRRADGSFKVV